MNWKSIIATALVTGIVTIATGILLLWWQSEKSELTYNSIKSIPFDDTSNKLFIQQIEIRNSGDKPIEDVIFVLSFSNEEIQKSIILIDNAISHQKQSDKKSIRLTIDNLNPNEGANVSVLFQSTGLSADDGAVSLRGKGVTGKLIGTKSKNDIAAVIIALVAAYTGIFTFVLTRRRIIPLLAKSILRGRSIDDFNQKNTIASLLAIYGYPDKAKDYLNSGVSRKYWVEADLLAAEAAFGDQKQRLEIIEVLKSIGEIPHIANGSKAIVYYNIARLAYLNDPQSSMSTEYLDLASELDKSEIKKRLSIDPVYKLKTENNKKLHADAS